MDIFEIAVRKFVSSFCIFGVPIVGPEMPFRVFTEPMHADKLILCLCRRLMFSPLAPAVGNDMPLLDEFFSVLERSDV